MGTVESDLIPLEFLVVGNGVTIAQFDWARLNPNFRVILTNGAWEKIPVKPDAVVASDEHWVKYNQEHCRYPQYTRPPWDNKWQCATVPGSQADQVTGPLALRLALSMNPATVFIIGFDIITLGLNERYHEHPIKGQLIHKPRRFEDQYWDVAKQAGDTQIHNLVTPRDYQTWCYK